MSVGDLPRLALGVLLPGFPGTAVDPEVTALLAEGLGGVCLFGGNTADGPEAVRRYADAVYAARPAAVIAIDEEGGDVTRLHVAAGSPVLGPAALGVADDLALTRTTGSLVGRELAALGLDLDLGPVADVNCEPDNPVIGTRSFGARPGAVARQVTAWLAGLQAEGVAGCVKHFPGHGATRADSHLGLPVLDVDRSVLDARELVPFRAAVAAGAAAVMTGHLLVPALDADHPASSSPTAHDLLRGELGFTGAVVTDALDMAGAAADGGLPAAAVRCLAAGADLLCLGADKDVALVRSIQSAIVAAVTAGRLSADRLAASGERLTALRRVRARAGATCDDGAVAAMLAGARAALRLDGTLPALAGARVVSLDTPASIAVGEAPWGLPPDEVVAPGGDLPAYGPLVVQVRDAHRQPGWHDQLAGFDRGVVVEWGWPGPRVAPAPRLCTHGHSRPAVSAVTEVLRGAGWDR